jgi:hypothetical protein
VCKITLNRTILELKSAYQSKADFLLKYPQSHHTGIEIMEGSATPKHRQALNRTILELKYKKSHAG